MISNMPELYTPLYHQRAAAFTPPQDLALENSSPMIEHRLLALLIVCLAMAWTVAFASDVGFLVSRISALLTSMSS